MALRYKIGLPPSTGPGTSDIGNRLVGVTIGGAPEQTTELPGDATEFTFDVERDQSVAIQVTDVDTTGNRSQPSPILAFTSHDNVPPPRPATPEVVSVEQTD